MARTPALTTTSRRNGSRSAHGRARLAISLREDFSPGSAPHKVDAAAGIIHGVKVVGRTSPNGHGRPGAQGTDYLLEALQNARGLYEGCKVFVNHRRRAPGERAERDVREEIGWLQNVVVTQEGLFADLHLLNESAEFSQTLLKAAVKRPQAFGLSHDADGLGDVRNGRLVIEEIPAVRSVDVVSAPATNVSLFESTDAMKTLKQLFESSTSKHAKGCLALLEDDYADMPAPAAEDAGDWKADLLAALGKLISSGDEGDQKKVAAIVKLMKPEAAAATPEADEEGDGKKGDEKEGDVKESREGQKPDPAVVALREEVAQLRAERVVREEAEQRGLPVNAALLESVEGLTDRAKIAKRLDALKSLVTKTAGRPPRSAAPGATRLAESVSADTIKTGKEFAAAVCG